MIEWFERYRLISVSLGLAVMAAIVLWPFVSYGFRSFKRQGIIFALILAGFLHSMATKPSTPNVIWDDYIRNDGTHYASNGVYRVGVNFRWAKTNILLPEDQPLYISKAATNSQDWALVATTTVGARSYNMTLANPDTFRYYVWHEWAPPAPVHTNGVWLGQFIEKAKGSSGTDKMIIIHGQLQKNGKVIAP